MITNFKRSETSTPRVYVDLDFGYSGAQIIKVIPGRIVESEFTIINQKSYTAADNLIFNLTTRARITKLEEPSTFVKKNLKDLINLLFERGANINFINPSGEGGAILEFAKDTRSFLIEISNDEQIVLVKRSTVPTEIFDLTESTLNGIIQEELK